MSLGATALNPPFACQRIGETIRKKGISLSIAKVQPRTLKGAIPSELEVEQAHIPLREKIHAYGLRERKVKGDGACQFRAVSDQLYGDEVHHMEVRRAAVLQLEKESNYYCDFVEGSYDAYLVNMCEPDTWGDHLTLQATADAFGLSINLLSSYSSDVVAVQPRELKSGKVSMYSLTSFDAAHSLLFTFFLHAPLSAGCDTVATLAELLGR
jgi:hypothetical protein